MNIVLWLDFFFVEIKYNFKCSFEKSSLDVLYKFVSLPKIKGNFKLILQEFFWCNFRYVLELIFLNFFFCQNK